MKIQRITFVTLLVVLLLTPAFATTDVSGNIKTLGATNLSNTFIRFWLRGCRGNQPRVTGVGILAPQANGEFYFDLPANASGQVAGSLYSTRDATGSGNGEIECGGSYTAVWYGMQVYRNSVGGPETPIHAKNGGSIDPSNITPNTTIPVVAAPTGDQTYVRLDGGNQPFTTSLSPSGTGTLNIGSSAHRWNGYFANLDVSGNLTGVSSLSLNNLSATTFNVGGTTTLHDTTVTTGVASISLTAPVFLSPSTNPAATGIVRLATGDAIAWRNNANFNDVLLTKNSSDQLVWPNGLSLGGGSALTSTEQSGTGNLCLTTNCQLTTPTLSSPTLNAVLLTGNPSGADEAIVSTSTTAAEWVAILKNTGYATSHGTSGYIKLPDFLGGLIIQWSQGSPSADTISVTMPLTFPHACYQSFGTTQTGTQTFSVTCSTTAWSLTGNGTYAVLAIGY